MMTRLSTFVGSAAVLASVAIALPAAAQQARIPIPEAQATLARVSHGSIRGVVLEVSGKPLEGAMVSALGATVAFALTARDGRFTLGALPMGAYTVRVHLDGYLPSRRQVVEVRGGPPSMLSVALRSLAAPIANVSTPVLAAGFAPFDAAPGSVRTKGQDDVDDPAEPGQTEAVWRLRHLKRSVLKTIDGQDVLAGDLAPIDDEGNRFGRAFESSIRFASSLLSNLPLTGQVNFVTTGALDGASDMVSPGAFAAASVAYIALGAPVGSWGQWSVRGAMRQGEVGSWFLTGAFSGRVAGAHRYSGGSPTGRSNSNRSTCLGAQPFAAVRVRSGRSTASMTGRSASACRSPTAWPTRGRTTWPAAAC